MDIKDCKKGLVVYHDRFGLLVVDHVKSDKLVVCNDGNVIVLPQVLERVTKEILDDRGVTQADLDAKGLFI